MTKLRGAVLKSRVTNGGNKGKSTPKALIPNQKKGKKKQALTESELESDFSLSDDEDETVESYESVESDRESGDVRETGLAAELSMDEFSEGDVQKRQLEFSEEDEAELESEEGASDDNEDESEEDQGPAYKSMAKKSKRIDVRRAEEATAHVEELRKGADETGESELEEFELGDVTEASDDPNMMDVTKLKTRIQNIVQILKRFKELRDPSIPREKYISTLQKCLAAYYGYSEYMLELLFPLFPPSELVQFLEASDVKRPVTIRTNTLKTRRRELAQALIHRGVQVEPIERWSGVGLQVFDSAVPLGATPEYLAGHYMLQAAASFLPVMALASGSTEAGSTAGSLLGERILDMCAAPGGKTTYIAQLMKNTGVLFANDVSQQRMKATAANLHRLGVHNSVLSVLDGRAFPGVIGAFDRVLLDAPCSGTGVISKDPSVKISKAKEDFTLLTHLQKELILAAIDSVDATKAGILVYSTCSITIEENEDIVSYALRKRPNIKLVETGLDFGTPGFTSYRGRRYPKEMILTRRFYPHTHNLDGFYVAKFQKTSNTIPMSEDAKVEQEAKDIRLRETKQRIKKERRMRAEFRAAKNKAAK